LGLIVARLIIKTNLRFSRFSACASTREEEPFNHPMAERRYTREDVDAILGRALERDRTVEGLSYDELSQVAAEVGISSASLENAIAEVTTDKQKRTELTELRREMTRGFLGHLIPYLCVNGLLVVINFATTRFPWALIPILGWGIGLFLHLFAVVAPSRERIDRRLARERDRQKRRQLKRELKNQAKEFEAVVGQGVAALLKAATEKVAQGTEQFSHRSTERVRVEDGVSVNSTDRSENAQTQDKFEGVNDQRRNRR
jgi:hypothetical protein